MRDVTVHDDDELAKHGKHRSALKGLKANGMRDRQRDHERTDVSSAVGLQVTTRTGGTVPTANGFVPASKDTSRSRERAIGNATRRGSKRDLHCANADVDRQRFDRRLEDATIGERQWRIVPLDHHGPYAVKCDEAVQPADNLFGLLLT
ncbi:MAG: hypothetical protein ACHREM_05755 [Polyangiales bacterium]